MKKKQNTNNIEIQNYQVERKATEKIKIGQCDYGWLSSYIRLSSDIQADIWM